MTSNRVSLGISLIALACSVTALVLVLRQSTVVSVEEATSAQEESRWTQFSLITETPDPLRAFQKQLARNEQILQQLRQGELTHAQDQ